MNEQENKIKLAIEALNDWEAGKLSDYAALTAIRLILKPQPKITGQDLAWAHEIIKCNEAELSPCPNCGETKFECACIRNKCMNCGKPVGNNIYTDCDECWGKTYNIDFS